MKKLFTLFGALIILFSANSQTKGYMSFKEVIFEVNGGNSEFILKNATRDSLGYFLVNKGGGVTEFRRALKRINVNTYLIGNDTLKVFNDTTTLSNRIYYLDGIKLNKVDTLNKWQPKGNYLTTEVDPTVPLWVKVITAAQIHAWDSSFNKATFDTTLRILTLISSTQDTIRLTIPGGGGGGGGGSDGNNYTTTTTFNGTTELLTTARNGTSSITADFSGTYPKIARLNDSLAAIRAGFVPNARTITINGAAQDLSANRTWVIDKTSVGLGNVVNVDQTNASNLTSGSIPAGRYASTTIPISAFNVTGTASATTILFGDGTWKTNSTSNITEGSNLYHTDARSRLAISATSPILYNNTTGVISAQVGSGSQPGVILSTDWNTFNNKANASHTHAAADIVSGVLATARLGTGTADSSKYLAGDGTWKSYAGSTYPVAGIYNLAPEIGDTLMRFIGSDAIGFKSIGNKTNGGLIKYSSDSTVLFGLDTTTKNFGVYTQRKVDSLISNFSSATPNIVLRYLGTTGVKTMFDRNDSLFSRIWRDTMYLKHDTTLAGSQRVYLDTAAYHALLRSMFSSGGGGGADGNAWHWNAPETLAATGVFGTLNNYGYDFKANNIKRFGITNGGNLLLRDSTDNGFGYGIQIGDTVYTTHPILINPAGSGLGSSIRAQLTIRGLSTSSSDYLINLVNSSNTIGLRIANDLSWSTPWASLLSSTQWRSGGSTLGVRATNSPTTTGQLLTLSPVNTTTATSSTTRAIYLGGNFGPPSGTAVYTGVEIANDIDKTSGGGVTRSLFVNPTLTNSPEHIAAEIATGRTIVKSIEYNYVAKTSAYTATFYDHTIACDATSGAFTITLPSATSKPGLEYIIKKTDSGGNTVTVATTSSQTIDGSTTYTGLSAQYKFIRVESNGSNWLITDKN